MSTLANGNGVLPGQIRAAEAGLGKQRLCDKVAIITGGASGIGREMAWLFATEGAQVVIADIQKELAQEAADEICLGGGRASAVWADISNLRSVQAMVAQTIECCDRVDILVNNAGVGLNKPFLDTSLEDWNRLLDVVLTGTFLCSQAAARVMVERKQGTIINIASISGQRGAQGRAAYGSAKAAVIQLTRVMAVELAPLGVRVNAISPGPVDTPQARATHTAATRHSYLGRIPLGRYGERHEVAQAAVFLASEEASFVHGHILNVDGGFFAAGLMFDPQAE